MRLKILGTILVLDVISTVLAFELFPNVIEMNNLLTSIPLNFYFVLVLSHLLAFGLLYLVINHFGTNKKIEFGLSILIIFYFIIVLSNFTPIVINI